MRYINGRPFIGDVNEVYDAVAALAAASAGAQGPVVYRAAGPGTPCNGTSYDPATGVTTAWGPCPLTPAQQGPIIALTKTPVHVEAVKTQQSLALALQQAIARSSPARDGLSDQYGAARGANVAAGRLIVDAMGSDADLRTRLAYTGGRIVNGEPALAAFARTLPADRARGFAIGVKVARAIGGLDPKYQAMVRAGMASELAAGFDLGIAKGNVGGTQKAGGPASSDSGIPSGVLIAGGVVAVLAAAAAIYKFTR